MNILRNIFLFFLLLYATNAAFFFQNIANLNLGTSFGFPIPWIFLGLPAFGMIGYAVLEKHLRLPYFFYFLVFELVFLFMETNAFRGSTYEPSFQYAYQLLILYIIFITIINYGIQIKDISTLYKYYLTIVSVVIFFIYLGYTGIIDYYMTDQFELTNYYRPIGGSMHTNGLSMICCVGIYMLTINKLLDNRFITLSVKYETILFFLLLSMIVVNSSRGAFLISTAAIYLYFREDWQRFSKMTKLISIYALILVIAYFVISAFSERFIIVQRFQDPDQWTSRLRQTYVSWVNFSNNPIIGTGYYFAARNVISGYVRSNFHYTQILASHGLVFFPIFIGLLVKFYGFQIDNKVGFLITFIGFTSLFFYNWTLLFCLAPLLYLKYYLNKTRVIE